MPNCTVESITLGKLGRRTIETSFDGGDLTSDAGVLLLKRADERIGLTRAAAAVFADDRLAQRVTHSIHSLLAQRIYGLCCGWEDVTDHNTLRHDLAWQTAVGRATALASGPTLCRLEAAATPVHTAALHGVLLDQFIASHAEPPQELILDIDATHVPLHGDQEKAHFHRSYWSALVQDILRFCPALAENRGWNHFYCQCDSKRKQYEIVQIAEDRHEIRNQIDRTERVSNNSRHKKFCIPRRVRMARSEIQRECFRFQDTGALFEVSEKSHHAFIT
jgi:hypothetical protein